MCLLVQEEHIQVKAMKVEDDEQHDKAMNLWFKQKQWRVYLSQAHYCIQAVQPQKKTYGEESSFSGGTRWQ